LWREFARILREIRPRFVFVENSANLVRLGLGRVLLDLAEIGFDARWNVLAAAAVGARHERERIWITGSMPPQLFPTVTINGNSNYKGASAKSGDGLFTVVKRLDSAAGGAMADAERPRLEGHRADARAPSLAQPRDRRPREGGGGVKFPSPQSRDFRCGQTRPHGWGWNLNKPQRNLNDLVLSLRHDAMTQSRPASLKPSATPHP
jgi:site-specific DNA-cytosine methylase